MTMFPQIAVLGGLYTMINALVPIFQRRIVAGLTGGAVKG